MNRQIINDEPGLNKERIKIMTKLAIYDKTHGESDRVANELFYRDYIYRTNFTLRLAAGIGVVIPFIFHFIFLFFTDGVDLLHFDFVGYFVNMGIVVGLVMVIYTFIGSHIATSEYKNIKLRLQHYFSLLRQLDETKKESYVYED